MGKKARLLSVLLCLFVIMQINATQFSFIFLTDPHYGVDGAILEENNIAALDDVNRLTTLGTDPFGYSFMEPQGVLVGGDCIDGGTNALNQWYGNGSTPGFTTHFGVNKDKYVKYYVFECWGNHDVHNDYGQTIRDLIRDRNYQRVTIHASSNYHTDPYGYNTSWEWQGIKFFNLGIFPGEWVDCEHSLGFLTSELSSMSTAQPVIIYFHYVCDEVYNDENPGWWTDEERIAFYNAVRNHNIVAIFHGHRHESSYYQWNGINVFNGGSAREHRSFFYVYINDIDIYVSERSNAAWAQTWRVAYQNNSSTNYTAIYAQGDNIPKEGKERAFDNDINTKWLDFSASSWITYKFAQSKIINGYSLTSANDYEERDPASWTLYGSNNNTSWTALDSRSGQDFPNRFETKSYSFTNNTGYMYYRFNLQNNSGTIIQLAEIKLIEGAATPTPTNTPQVTSTPTPTPPPSTWAPIPGTIEAENYDNMSGIQTEACSEGGENVGWIEAGDWMDYNVSITAGTYTVSYRVASLDTGGSLSLQIGGTTYNTVSFAATGGWQTWTSVTGTVTLPGGNQTIRIYANQTGWNINYFTFTGTVATATPTNTTQNTATPTRTPTPSNTPAATSTPVSGTVDITNQGGPISAQYTDSPAGEDIAKLIDNTSSTKYLTFHASGWVQYQGIAAVITKYTITSANDAAERDPYTWTLSGSNNGSSWTTLDSRSGEDFPNRFQLREFSFANSTSYSYYRLQMTNNSGTILQLAEWEIYGTTGTVNTATPTNTTAATATPTNTPAATSTPTPVAAGFSDNFNDNAIGSAWTMFSGTWSESGGILRQDSTSQGDPCKAIVVNSGLNVSGNHTVTAKVYINSWTDGDTARAGVSLFTGTGDGAGYNLLFHNNHSTVQFLDDRVAWGTSYTFNWSNQTWYWFKMKMENGTLYGKVWQDGAAEPPNWPYTWTRSGRTGYPALNGGTSGHGGSCTVFFDDVTITSP
ncbi:MAG: carbohydrate-binding protein [Spirochaetales bacterium]|nr:carbohydrate-binding protein [Spirochaetales bacterium]